MKILVGATLLFFVSCITMKNADTPPTEGTCVLGYEWAKTGEKEAIAGVVLLPVGATIAGFSPLLLLSGAFGQNEPKYNSGIALAVIGPAAIIAGTYMLIEGYRRVDNWNDHCVGATAAERYCLYEGSSTEQIP